MEDTDGSFDLRVLRKTVSGQVIWGVGGEGEDIFTFLGLKQTLPVNLLHIDVSTFDK